MHIKKDGKDQTKATTIQLFVDFAIFSVRCMSWCQNNIIKYLVDQTFININFIFADTIMQQIAKNKETKIFFSIKK